MQKKRRTNTTGVIPGLILVVILVLSACAPAAPAATQPPAPTQDVAAIETQSAATVYADLTAGAPTPLPPPPGPTTDPNIPVAILPTPAAGEPAATALYNASIYSGPGTNYVLYATLLGGANAKVVGKSEDGLWWAISIPIAPSGAGWVDAGYVTVSNADSVSVLPTPPVPPTVEMVPPEATDPQVISHRERVCAQRSGHELPRLWSGSLWQNRPCDRQE